MFHHADVVIEAGHVVAQDLVLGQNSRSDLIRPCPWPPGLGPLEQVPLGFVSAAVLKGGPEEVW